MLSDASLPSFEVTLFGDVQLAPDALDGESVVVVTDYPALDVECHRDGELPC